MIETIILNYLNDELDVPCTMEEDVGGNSFVLIEKTGSSKINHVSTATIALQSYAPSLAQAAALNERVKAAMERIVDLDDIGGVHLNSDYNFTDMTTKRYRYQAVFVVIYVG